MADGYLTGLVKGFAYIAILVGIVLTILANLGSGLTGDASTAINTSVTDISTQLVGRYDLILIIAVFGFIWLLAKVFMGGGSGGSI